MPLSTLLNRPCTLLLRETTGTINDDGIEEHDAERYDTVCELQQQQRREPTDQGELSDTTWLLILPAGTMIDTGDAVEIDGELYELVGAPWRVRNPRTTSESHVECTLRRTAGAEDRS